MASKDRLSCQEVVDLVTEYLENALLPEMHERLEEHIAECPGCEHNIEQIRLTIDLLHRTAQEPGFPGTKQELLQLFRNWKKSSEAQ